MEEGLNYVFKLEDLPKYSQTLHPRDLNDRFLRSALGKRIPTIAEKLREQERL
jgi:hypothetical protein